MNKASPFLNIARSRLPQSTGMQNAGWCYDNYPEIKQLDAHSTTELANIDGPGVVTCFHITQHRLPKGDLSTHFADWKLEKSDRLAETAIALLIVA